MLQLDLLDDVRVAIALILELYIYIICDASNYFVLQMNRLEIKVCICKMNEHMHKLINLEVTSRFHDIVT